ncbi:hypothetical protein AX15_000057 [Amanita polypyramis BW_CC]|nr:hypothetical protein AX15_000057 [Amanita polypyramis BW_CC]
MKQSQSPTSFLGAIVDTFSLLLNTPLVEPEIPKKPMAIPLKALPPSHTPFSRGIVLEDVESASDQPSTRSSAHGASTNERSSISSLSSSPPS